MKIKIFDAVIDYISNLQVLKEWPECMELVARAASHQPRDWTLPPQVAEAVGGTTEFAIPASASVACALIGILLIDDMLDRDPRGAYLQVGEAQAANFASVFLTAASEAILQSQVEATTKLRAWESLNRMLLTVPFGQFLDVQNPADEATYWRVVQTKSSPFFCSVMELGALFGGAPENVVRQIGKIGELYGEMIQIHDDMDDCLAVPANADWLQGRSPLPILYAESVNHPARERFLQLRPFVLEAATLSEAQGILISCGAISYCVDRLLHTYQTARNSLRSLPLIRPERVENILDGLVTPVWQLFETLGTPWREDYGAEAGGGVMRPN